MKSPLSKTDFNTALDSFIQATQRVVTDAFALETYIPTIAIVNAARLEYAVLCSDNDESIQSHDQLLDMMRDFGTQYIAEGNALPDAVLVAFQCDKGIFIAGCSSDFRTCGAFLEYKESGLIVSEVAYPSADANQAISPARNPASAFYSIQL